MSVFWGNVVGRGVLLLVLLCVACGEEQTPSEVSTLDSTPLLSPVAGGALVEENTPLLEGENVLGRNELVPGAPSIDAIPEPSVPLPTIDPLEVNGDITVGGSATVYPVTRHMYRRFVREGYAGTMKIERVGTGEGFRLLCSVGTADIVNAGRVIQESEKQVCSSINRTPMPFAIGQSTVSVFAHPDNEFLTTVSLVQLRAIFTATLWSDVNPAWPEEPIERLLPRPDSDEFTAFVRLVMADESEVLLNRPNTTVFDTENELLQALTEGRYAIGFASHLLLWQERNDFLRAVPVERHLPDETTVTSGAYPLVYPLYLYTDADILRRKPQVAAFLTFYLSHINEEIRQVGYFPVDAGELDAARARLMRILEEREDGAFIIN